MLAFAVIAVAIVVTGTAALSATWQRLDGSHDLHPLELIVGGTIAGLGAWLAIHWALALSHTLTRGSIAGVAALFVLAAIAIAVRHVRARSRVELSPDVTVVLACLLPIFLWTIFILWRGTVIPPLSHDALAYHLPKAVLMMRAHGFEAFVAPDARIGTMPANYEMLLADVLILSGSDRLTEWIGTSTFVFFLLGAAAIAKRWGSGPAGVVAAVLATASAPVVLLHSGADKNDLLTAFLGLAALLFGARWCVSGGRTSAAVAILAAVIGLGTKQNLGAVAAGLAPFALWRIWRSLRERRLLLRDVAATAAFIALVFLLCGGWSYIANWRAQGAAMGVGLGETQVSATLPTFRYGDWFNLWQVPLLLFTIPFSANPSGVWVPWAREYWFWPHYEIYWSHYGVAFSLGVVLLPFTVWRYRPGTTERRRERRIGTIAGVAAVALMLPIISRPIGFYGTYPRYLLVILPVLFAWTLAPMVDARWHRRKILGNAILVVLALLFSYNAVLCAEKDRFAPLEYVLWAAEHPGNRSIPFMGGRAASVADRRAGPHDKIAVEGSFETWVYPAYGATLSRPVVFLPPAATPADVPQDADWVIVDRSWNTIWGGGLEDMGDGWTKLAKGKASPEETRFTESMKRDPRFRLVYHLERFNQAVFRRVTR